MNKEPIVKEVSINAPVSRVWKAITDMNELRKWFFDITDFEPLPDAQFIFNAGGENKKLDHVCTLKEVEENKRLSYTLCFNELPGEESLVSFELFDEGNDVTRLRLTHSGLEGFTADRVFTKDDFNGGWELLIKESIKEYIEQGKNQI